MGWEYIYFLYLEQTNIALAKFKGLYIRMCKESSNWIYTDVEIPVKFIVCAYSGLSWKKNIPEWKLEHVTVNFLSKYGVNMLLH